MPRKPESFQVLLNVFFSVEWVTLTKKTLVSCLVFSVALTWMYEFITTQICVQSGNQNKWSAIETSQYYLICGGAVNKSLSLEVMSGCSLSSWEWRLSQGSSYTNTKDRTATPDTTQKTSWSKARRGLQTSQVKLYTIIRVLRYVHEKISQAQPDTYSVFCARTRPNLETIPNFLFISLLNQCDWTWPEQGSTLVPTGSCQCSHCGRMIISSCLFLVLFPPGCFTYIAYFHLFICKFY